MSNDYQGPISRDPADLTQDQIAAAWDGKAPMPAEDGLTQVVLFSGTVARLDQFVERFTKEREQNGEPNGLTNYSGVIDWALDMAADREADTRTHD